MNIYTPTLLFIDKSVVDDDLQPWERLNNVIRQWAMMTGFEKDLESYEKNKNQVEKTYTTQFIEDPKNSESVILPFPDEILEKMNWKEGTVLEYELVNDGFYKSLVFRAKK